MPRAISYIRFSSTKQSAGSSHQRQQEAVARWLLQNADYSLSELEFTDLGKSGYHGDHIRDGGGWAKLLLAVDAGAITAGDVVLVEAMDRTGRLPPLDMIDIIKPVLKAGVAIITLDDGNRFDEDSLNGPQIYLLVAKIQAAYGYSRTLSERTKASYQIRKEKAKKGEKVKRFAPIWLTVDGDLKDDLATYIKQVFDLYISGVGKNAIANRLRASALPEFETCSGPTVDGWLKNKAAIGYWGDIPDVYPAVVSREVFLQAQKRQQEVRTEGPTRTSKNFLVGLVKCGVCGANYIIHNKNGVPNNMRCLTHHRLGDAGCINKETIPYPVIRYAYSVTSNAWIEKAIQKIQLTANDKRKLSLEAELEEVAASIQKVVEVIKLVPDVGELSKELSVLSEKRKSLEEELLVLNRTEDVADGHHGVSLIEDDLLINDPVRLTSLLKGSGYTITVYPQKLMVVTGQLYPLKYLGVERAGNATVGYRVLEFGTVSVISPGVPETPDWGRPTTNPLECVRYQLRRAHKYISTSQPYDHEEYG